MNNTVHNRIFRIARREVFRIATRPLYLFCMIIAPLFCYLFFTTLMWNGLPTDMPAGVVDLDNTATTRSIIRNLDAFQQTKIIAHYPSFADARKAMQQGKIYAFYYIPKGTTDKALASRQPKVSFYTNYSYLVAGSLLYKDQRTMSELAGEPSAVPPYMPKELQKTKPWLPAAHSHRLPCIKQPMAQLFSIFE